MNRPSATDPDDALIEFFSEQTHEIEEAHRTHRDFIMSYKAEMRQLNTMIQDLRQNGSDSSTFRSIVQASFPPIHK